MFALRQEMEDILQTAYSRLTEANITLSAAALSEAIRQVLNNVMIMMMQL